MVEQEFVATLAVMDRQGSTLPRVFREAWDGEVLRTLTRSPLTATGAHITVLAHCTPGELKLKLKEAQLLGGTLNRFIPIASRRTKLLADGGNVPETVLKTFAGRLADSLDKVTAVREVKRSDEAVDLWREEYGRIRRSRPDGPVACLLARAAPQILRTALCYALACGSVTIERDHLAASIALWTYAESSAEWLFGAQVERAEVDELVEYIRAGGTEGRTRTEISSDHFQRNKTAAEVGVALAELLRDGQIRQKVDKSGRGRPVTRFVAC